MIRDASEILGLLLEGEHSTVAGRLVGAFRNIGQEKIADQILKTMQAAGYDVRETDPFESETTITIERGVSPYVNRIKLMWNEMREVVIKYFPKAPGIPKDTEKYMKLVDEIYVTDAYHSLSIERYRVTPELIERVRIGAWDIGKNDEDKKQKDAMAARGYWQATQKVRESIVKILTGENAGKIADSDHGDWYRELFAPSVTTGILKASDLAGYRNGQVYIGQSKHVPLNVDAVRDAMPVLFELLQKEPEASVRAVLGHFVFVFIHPYMDGNGRMGRFLMNAMLASGGYPWTVIPVEERKNYMEALEKASSEKDIETFAKYLGYLVNEGLKGTPVATIKVEPEYPPYKFYKNPKGAKYETRTINVDEKFSSFRLANIILLPIEEKHKLALEIIVESEITEKKNHHFNLSDLVTTPIYPNSLFFDNKNRFIEIELPKGRKRLTVKVILLSDVNEFDLLLACEYV
jgi:Fic family protein